MKIKTTKKACEQFAEDQKLGLWELFCTMGFSQKYCYENFIRRDQMNRTDFNRLMKETGLEFLKPSQCRDKPHKRK